MSDELLQFAFEGMPVRGALAKVGEAWSAIRSRNPVEPAAESLLGEAVAASALMFSNIKLQGQISLQLQGTGPIRLLLAQCTHDGMLRGVVNPVEGAITGVEDFRALTRDATLAITMERFDNSKRYQGIVPLSGHSLAEGLEGYFRQSEQLPTRLWLAADGAHAAGLLLQRMPGEAADPDGWNRVVALADTLAMDELVGLEGLQVLRRLFHREEIAVNPPRRLAFACRCTRQRVVEVLQALGQEQIMTAANHDDQLEVNCEFCNEIYRFDTVDLAQIFRADTGPGSGTVQ